MNWCRNIGWISLLFISMEAIGQGNVVVHSDPRLAVLLRKVHPEPIVPALVHKTETKLLASASVSAPKRTQVVPMVGNPVLAGSNSSHMRPAELHPPVKAEQPVAALEKPVAALAVHEHLWTPPVLPKARAVTMGKGFRVQIYNGSDRTKAIEVKAEFMRAHPAVGTYLNYVAPHFRVKVGDYRNRGEAAMMLKEVNKKYSPSMIVPDVVTITTF